MSVSMSNEEVRCECGHHCCKECKCAENPDPIRDFELCPCTKCKDSVKECKPEHYSNPKMYYVDPSRIRFHEKKFPVGKKQND